jgi:tetrapyrrole methylase family protein/MazG family protein/ATP diphosphatase
MKAEPDLSPVARLLAIMARLRDRARGCPWDLEQTFATIAPYTIEEAYEVADAIERQDLAALKDELGDLLFQVVFHARMAEEEGAFDFSAVAETIGAKMLRRHPHVFGEQRVVDSAEQSKRWEEIKREERAAGVRSSSSVLDDVPVGLPALTRAVKLGKRAATVGFDWPDAAGARGKVVEELGELDAAAASGDARAMAAEMGDLLLAVANWCRHLDLDPESCLRDANARFARRFRAVEAAVGEGGRSWSEHDAAELDALWRRAKADEA